MSHNVCLVPACTRASIFAWTADVVIYTEYIYVHRSIVYKQPTAKHLLTTTAAHCPAGTLPRGADNADIASNTPSRCRKRPNHRVVSEVLILTVWPCVLRAASDRVQ